MAIDAANALVTMAQTKLFMKITTGGDDSIIESFINKASIWANEYTGRYLLSRTVTDYYDGDGTGTLLLKQYPVTSITNIYDDVDRAFGGNTAIAAANMVINADDGIVRLYKGSVSFSKGLQNIKAVYVAGYTVPPETVKEAVLFYIAHLYRRQYADQKFGVQSETIGDRTTTYADDDIVKKAKTLLNNYRSERVLFSGF